MKSIKKSPILLLGLFAALAAGHAQEKPGAAAATMPIRVSARQAEVRALEKWITVQTSVESLPDSKTARLVFFQEPGSERPVQKGQAVKVPLPPPRAGFASGVVEKVAAAADPRTGMIRVEILADNPGQALAKGKTFAVEIQVLKRPNLLAAPLAAIVREEGRAFVFRLDQGSGRTKVEKVAVATGYSDDAWIEIHTGLWPGQWLAVSHLDRLADGVTVLAQPAPR